MLTQNPSDSVTPALDVEAFRSVLEAELARREEIVLDLTPRATPNVDPVAYSTLVSTRQVMDRIAAALDRIAEGTYGRCIRCGGAIVTARLEVLPYAETCIDCQNEVERA